MGLLPAQSRIEPVCILPRSRPQHVERDVVQVPILPENAVVECRLPARGNADEEQGSRSRLVLVAPGRSVP